VKSHHVLRVVIALLTSAGLVVLGCGIAATIFVGVAATPSSSGGGGGGVSNSARFNVSSSLNLLDAEMVGGSDNIVGPPQVVQTGPDEYQITVELAQVPDNEPVYLTFAVHNATVPTGQLHMKSVAFYPVPPSQLPPVVQPPLERGPLFAWRNDSQLGVVLDVSNQNNAPMNLTVDGAESPVVYNGSQVHYDGLTGLSWTPLAGTTLSPHQTTTIDLPDDAAFPPAPAALLLRYVSTVSSIVQKGACQLEMTGPINTDSSTWGAIKALYR
jgi:hypothetical protein